MKKRGAGVFWGMVMVSAILFSACAVQKKYVGLRVNPESPYLCNCAALPAECLIGGPDSVLPASIHVEPGEMDGEYLISGFLEPSKGSFRSFDVLVQRETRLYILIIRDAVVVDIVSFLPQGEYISGKWPFSVKYQGEPFDAVTISGNIMVLG